MRTPLLAGTTALTTLAAALATAAPARAAYVVTFSQLGPNVVASGSGSIDIAELSSLGPSFEPIFVQPEQSALATGKSAESDAYFAMITGPASGSGGRTLATSGTGDIVGLNASTGEITVPIGYAGGRATLNDTATYAGATFASLGLTPGSYVYTYGMDPSADTFTINIGLTLPRSVPEPASLPLLGAGLLGLAWSGAITRTGKAAGADGSIGKCGVNHPDAT